MEHRSTRPGDPQRVADILPAPGMMLARCDAPACRAVTALDIAPPLHSYLKQTSLTRLEDQLRCTCGGRRGRLEAWPAGLPTPASQRRLYLFLI